MYSFSKAKLTQDMAQAIISAHFGPLRRLKTYQELEEGLYNAAALLELDDDLKYVLKVAPSDDVRVLRYEHNIMQAEVGAMRLVRAQTQAPVAEIYAYDTSRQLLNNDYFLMEFLPGVPLHKLRKDLPSEAQTSIDQSIGRLAREISSINGDCFGYFAQSAAPGVSWRDVFAAMLKGILKDGEEIEVKLPLPYASLFQCLEAHFGALNEVKTPKLVHWDLWDGNIFIDPASTQISGVIDFERVLWGDPLIEVIFCDTNPQSNFSRGFGQDVLTSETQVRRRLLYNAYLYLIMIIECYYRRYTDGWQENWAREQLDTTLKAF